MVEDHSYAVNHLRIKRLKKIWNFDWRMLPMDIVAFHYMLEYKCMHGGCIQTKNLFRK